MQERLGLIIVQRNEGWLLALNVVYHLSLGVTRVVVVDNNSDDSVTLHILARLETDPAVEIVRDRSSICDQAALANRGLARLSTRSIDWVLPCDADEFLWLSQSLNAFLTSCRSRGRLYMTVPWLNHLPDTHADQAHPLAYVRSGRFYVPFAERSWHEPGHFRKALCAREGAREIVVGGHYFRREANVAFFDQLSECPAFLPAEEALLVHFDLRDCGRALLRKFRDLSARHVVSGIAPGPWREKEELLGQLASLYADNPDALFSDYAERGRTVWGSAIPESFLHHREDLLASITSALDKLSGESNIPSIAL